MLFQFLANAVLVIHLLFILFVAGGALLLFPWPRLAWLHLPCVVWGVLIEYYQWICPLTPLENYFRQRAGHAGYDAGFIDHYVSMIIYPPGLTSEIQILLAIAIVLVNVMLYSAAGYRYFSKKNRR